MNHVITCPRCRGSARIPIASHLEDTLALVPNSGSVSASDLYERDPSIGITGYNNRLEELRAAGLLKRVWKHRGWRYSRKAAVAK